MDDVLDEVAASWRPAPVTVRRRVDPLPLVNFADALDVPAELGAGDPVPLLWHWLTFTPGFRRSLLAEDGHPREAPMIPDFPFRRRMMAGGRVRHERPLVVDREYERRTEAADVRVKTGRSGRMLMVTIRHTFTDLSGEAVAIEEEDVVYRQQRAGELRPLSRPEIVDAPWHAGGETGLRVPTDSRLLFRFSALTYNTHPIHYDEPYARDVEGYPALVVHGPLLALLMLEAPRRAGLDPSGFEYRLRAPTYCGDHVLAMRRDLDTVVGAVGRAVPSGDGRILGWYGAGTD